MRAVTSATGYQPRDGLALGGLMSDSCRVSFLGQLSQITTNWVAEKRNVFCHSCGGQKAQIKGLTGAKDGTFVSPPLKFIC